MASERMRVVGALSLAIVLAGCHHHSSGGIERWYARRMGIIDDSAQVVPRPWWWVRVNAEAAEDLVGARAMELCHDNLRAGWNTCSTQLGGCLQLMVDARHDVWLQIDAYSCDSPLPDETHVDVWLFSRGGRDTMESKEVARPSPKPLRSVGTDHGPPDALPEEKGDAPIRE